MGKNTKIICTVVPNPTRTKELRKEAGKEKFSAFSVFLTPRLPDSGILKDYYEIVNWFKFLSVFTNNQWLKVRLAKLTPLTPSDNSNYTLTEELKNDKPIGYEVARDSALSKSDYFKNYNENDYDKLGKKIWEKMFPNSTPVKGWIFDEGDKKDNKVTQIFTKDEVDKFIGDAKLREKGVSVSVSELTAEQRKQMTENLGLGDIAAKKMSEDEIRLRNKENQEFHKKISILSDYPHLLRLTGWIFDFQIEDSITTDFNIIKLDFSGLSEFIRNQSSSNTSLWANFSNEIDFKTPWTYVDKTTFSIRYLDKFKKEYFEIENGFMKASGEAYNLVACQFDHKQLVSKISNTNETEKEDIKKVFENRANDLTSTGIGIKVVREREKDNKGNELKDAQGKPIYKKSPFITGIEKDPDSLNGSITVNGKKNDSANIDDYIIFGHNLDTGYRVDVAMSKDGGTTYSPFKSLCWRNADYKIDTSPYSDKRAFINLLTNFKDEPWISESAQAGKSGTLYVDEELCRWNNWSLTCPHIGNYPQDETNVKENHEFNDLELKNIRPSRIMVKDEQGKNKEVGSLTPLRFSRKYKFRIRVVDICGNSISCDIYDNDTKTFVNTPTPVGCEIELQEDFYKRLETVNPPELHFTQNVFEGRLKNKKGDFVERKLKSEFHGEDLNTLVVRTKIKNGEIITPKESIRSVCPPRVTQSFVELHGTVDDLLKNPKERKSVYEKASYENTNTDVEVFKPKEEIPFLTDPITTFFDVRVFKDAQKTTQINSNGSNNDIWKKDKDYINRKFNSIELKSVAPKDTKNEIITKSINSVAIELKVGSILHGEIESIITQLDESSFHVDAILKDKNDNSKHSLPKELLFINAVQKPVILNDDGTTEFNFIYNLEGVLSKRTPSTPISLAFESLTYSDSKFPLSTTGEIKVIAEYDEIICDKTKKQGFRVEKKKLVKAFSNFGEGITLNVFNDESSKKDLSKKDENKSKVGLLDYIGFKSLEHSFGDTKYRSVKYSIELVSRFKDYFPNENEFSVLGTFNKQIEIENSKKLEALVIDSIVPVFNWTESENEVVRKHDTFRIYLEGDWYQNGASLNKDSNVFEEVEKVAVFFLENEDTIPDEYEGLVSEFGKDPSTNTNNDRTNGLNQNIFAKADSIVGTNSDDRINSLLLERGESSFSAPLQIPATAKDIKAAVFPINFDFTKKKFYCDIKINIPEDKKLYFPFLKLAVARYLKTSIKDKENTMYDYRFSNIITAPQVQVFPVRKIDKKNNFSIFQSTGVGSNIFNDVASKKLEVYLIMERNNEAEFSKLIDEKNNLNSIHSIKLNKADDSLLSIKDKEVDNIIKEFKPTRMYIEEFEVYNVWDTDSAKDFKMSEENYNPRNDIRKRLVFTYQIK